MKNKKPKKENKKTSFRLEENVELIAKHVIDMDRKFSSEFADISVQILKIKTKISDIDLSVSRHESKTDKVIAELEEIKEIVEGIDKRLNAVENKIFI